MNKTIKSCCLLEPKTKNTYFHDQKKKRTHLCHPLMGHILKMDISGKDPKHWIDNLPDGFIEVEDIGTFTKNDILYYFQKYLLLKENRYFSQIDQPEIQSVRLDGDTVKKTLAQCKHVVFEVTDSCNLMCEYCGYGKFYFDYDKRENKNLDIATAKNLLNHLKELWNSPLNQSFDQNIYISFYGGEPLLNMPFIKAVVKYINGLNLERNRISFAMTTNAILLEKHMDFLKENNFNLLISLDGNKKNNDYRVFKNGTPTFETILRNVKALQNKYPDYFDRMVNFNAVLHNKNSVSDIYNYFKKQFNKKPNIAELSSSGIRRSQEETFRQTFADITESLYQNEDYAHIEKDMFIKLQPAKQAMAFIHNYNEFCFQDYNALIYADDSPPRLPTGTCIPFSKKIFLTVNGKILPCERIGQQYSLGSVTPESVELDYDKIAGIFNGHIDKVAEQCNQCHNSENCTQCVYNLNLHEEKPVCHNFMTNERQSRYLSSVVGYIESRKEIYPKIVEEVIID